MSWTSDLLALQAYQDGVEHSPQRRKIDFIGASLEDDARRETMVVRIGNLNDWKGSVRVATTGDMFAVRVGNTITASANGSINGSGIDGVTDLVIGDLALFRAELAPADNGIWRFTDLGSASSPWVAERATLADQSAEVTCGLTTYAEEGVRFGRTSWRLKTVNPIELNVTALEFETLDRLSSQLVTGGPYPATAAQRVLLCDTTGGPFTVTLPAGSEWAGGFFYVKDVGGVAGANNISLQHSGGTIDTGATYTLNTNRRAVILYSSGGADLHVMSTG